MSETPDISMDLLELEDAVPPPDIGSVFLEEEGEEESPREEDDVAWAPFLGPNPMTEVEFLFEDLFLVEVSPCCHRTSTASTWKYCRCL